MGSWPLSHAGNHRPVPPAVGLPSHLNTTSRRGSENPVRPRSTAGARTGLRGDPKRPISGHRPHARGWWLWPLRSKGVDFPKISTILVLLRRVGSRGNGDWLRRLDNGCPKTTACGDGACPLFRDGRRRSRGKGGQAPWRQRFSRCQTNLRHGASPHFPPTLRSSARPLP